MISVKSTGKNTEHSPQPVAWLCPFFIHHRTANQWATSAFTLTLQGTAHEILRKNISRNFL